MSDDCERCGEPAPAGDGITIYWRLNGVTILKSERYHHRCCPFAFFGRLPAEMIHDTWTEPPPSQQGDP